MDSAIAERIDLAQRRCDSGHLVRVAQSVLTTLCFLAGAEIDGKAHLSPILSDKVVSEKKLNASAPDPGKLAKEIQGGGGGQAFTLRPVESSRMESCKALES